MKSMKSFLFQILLMTFLFPAMVLSVTQLNWQEEQGVIVQFVPQEDVRRITLRLGEEGMEMDLEEYVTQVVLAEMPAAFEVEALKAQAIAARTFAWKAHTTGGKHGDGTVCVNAGCCQGFVSRENFLGYYGTAGELQKIEDATKATADMVITYNHQLIEAAYFSSAGGSTEDAVAVWGGDYPYLTAKDSPEEAAQGEESRAFSSTYLEMVLNTRLEGEPEEWFHDWEYTTGGGVASVGIGNRMFTGTQVRKLLELRSTVFTVSIANDVVFFHTLGHGHRVGMSQYGANALAEEGKSCEEILMYYYSGIQLEPISSLEKTELGKTDEISLKNQK